MPAVVVNGVAIDVDVARFDPNHTTLSQWLRAQQSTGTKEGCAEGDCGACSVAYVDDAGQWRSMTSCIAPLGLLLGKEIRTAEGLRDAEGHLHPVQAAMVKHYGSQCGYCTPGFVTSMFEGYERGLAATDSAGLADQLCGNLCRCTGYRPIRDAMVEALVARDAGVVGDDLVAIGCKKQATKTPPSTSTQASAAASTSTPTFLRPTTVDELIALRAAHPSAVLVAGATELGVLLRKRNARFPVLIETTQVRGLSTIERVSKPGPGAPLSDGYVVGATATLGELEAAWLSDTAMAPAVRMLRVFASRQIKNRATLAGNIVTASPISDMAPVLLALGAQLELRSARGVRVVDVDGFFVGYRKTLLAADEIVTRFFIPRPGPRARFRTFKVSKRRELDIAIVSAAFFVDVDGAGVVSAARLAFGGVAATPALAKDAAALLVGRTVAAAAADVGAALAGAFQPLSDVRAQRDYRLGLVPSLWQRFVDNVVDDAHDGDLAFVAGSAYAPPEHSKGNAHESAVGHVTGGAHYVDDIAERRDCLELWPVQAGVAHGRLNAIDVRRALAVPGVRAVLTAQDIPGENDVGAIRKDEPLLPAVGGAVTHHGQVVAVVVADSVAAAKAGAAAVVVDVAPLPAILGIRAAIAAQSFHPRLDGEATPHTMKKGDAPAAMARAAHRFSFAIDIGGQEHFYLETHAALAEPGDDGDITVLSSTQHPSEVQAVVSHVLHKERHQVVVVSPRMGGGFGGKETQGNLPAALVALAATKLSRPARLQWDRDIDMEVTGKRHPFYAEGEVGFDDDGRVTAFVATLYADGGHALDLSESIHDRALFHIDNCYDFPNVLVSGRVCKTHVVSHTAFRGFGGPQGMLVVEDVLTQVAQHLGLAPEVVRARNFYAAEAPHGHTHYHQVVDDFRVARMWPALLQDAEFAARRATIHAFNQTSPHVKRGLAITPVKFGISFTASFLNQAGALVHLYRDGSAQVNHGGTEMGQGLYTKILGIAQRELGLPRHKVRVMQTRTDKVPNTSATAASSGADLNGAAVVAALVELRERLLPVARALLAQKAGRADVEFGDVEFVDGVVRGVVDGVAVDVGFAALCEAAYVRQVSLSATGFYKTPDIGYNKKLGRGKPFHYFSYGVACAEVELDGTTGLKRVRRVDVLHDAGDSLHPAIDRGQVEGALVQGIGWLTGEELVWSGDGRLLSHSASTYAIPSFSDAPAELRVRLLDDTRRAQSGVVHGSKAVGEPPFMLAFAVREALKDAIAAFGPAKGVDDAAAARRVHVRSPLTHEALFQAVQQRRR